MADAQSKIGILFLADIVDYTAQSHKFGTDKTAQFNEQFEQKVRDLTKTHKGDFIKTIGDAVLIFLI